MFHVEEKIVLRTWDDILSHLNFRSPVRAKKFRFRRIAALYSFKEQSARCSVSYCQQAHGRGYLVTTSDEMETNLCEVCGQRLLNTTFSNSKKVLQDLARVRKQQIRLNRVLEQSAVIRDRVKELKRTPKRSQLAAPDANHVS